MWDLSVWETKELTCFLLVRQYRTCPILIPNVFGICPVIAISLLSRLGSSGVPAIVRSSNVLRVTDKVTVGAVRPIPPVLIPDVSGMCPATIKFLLFSGWFIGSSNNGREFWCVTLNWLRWFTVLVISDVLGMDDQRPTTSFQNALRVRSSDVSWEFWRS